MFSALTGRKYDEVRKQVNQSSLTENGHHMMSLPTRRKLAQNRPEVEVLTTIKRQLDEDNGEMYNQMNMPVSVEDDIETTVIDDENDYSVLSPAIDNLDSSKFTGETEELDLVARMVETEDLSVYGARIKGDCETYISLMENKHRAEGRDMREQEIIVIDSIDGAEHLKSKSSVTNI